MVRLSAKSKMTVALTALGCATVVCVCACSSATTTPSGDCAGVELLVAASDYNSSLVCGAPDCESGPSTSGMDLGKDPALATSNGRAFFIARDTNYVFELDPTCGRPTARYRVDDALEANPHDAAVAPDGSIFVVLYGVPRIAILKKDGSPGESIDLSMYDIVDHNPQADAIRIVTVGGVAKAFVSLEVLDDRYMNQVLVSRRPSSMLRIDVATRKVEDNIPLAGRNPFNAMAESNDGALFLAEPGNFDSDSDPLAGIERFDTTSSTTRLLVTEHDLGGSVSEVAVTDGCGAAIVAGPAHDINPTSLVTFDPTTGKVFTTAKNAVFGPTANLDLDGLVWRGNSLYVGDRRSDGAGYPVHVFDRDPGTCNLHESMAAAIHLPQRPVALRSAR